MTYCRALCAELVDALDSWHQAFHLGGVPPQDGADAKLITRARAALAQPEPVGPTDEELVKHYGRSVTSAIDSRVAMHLLTDEDLDAATAAGLLAVLARSGRPAITPIPVSERLPEAGKKVIVHYVNSFGNSRTVCAEWVPSKARTDDCLVADDDFAEYDEENDIYYWPEGWYESIENWDEYGAVFINDAVTHWQPLPSGPASAQPLPEGGAA